MFILYIFVVVLFLAGAGISLTGFFVVGIPLLLIAGALATFVLLNRGMKMELSRRTGQQEVPSSREASYRTASDPSQPLGGTTADASDPTGSVGRG